MAAGTGCEIEVSTGANASLFDVRKAWTKPADAASRRTNPAMKHTHAASIALSPKMLNP